MAELLEIKCINKSDRTNPHERIKNVGGTGWKMTEDDAIKAIESKQKEFYTHGDGKYAKVIVATHLGRKYLKTEADGITPDNLLALPECK